MRPVTRRRFCAGVVGTVALAGCTGGDTRVDATVRDDIGLYPVDLESGQRIEVAVEIVEGQLAEIDLVDKSDRGRNLIEETVESESATFEASVDVTSTYELQVAAVGTAEVQATVFDG